MRLLFLANWPLKKDTAGGYAFFTHWKVPPRLTLMGTFRLGPWTRFEKTRLRFYLLAPLVAYVRSLRYDLVVAYSSQVGLPLALLFRLTGRRTSLVVFDVESFGRVRGGLALRLARFAAARIDRVVYAASRQRNYYQDVMPEILPRTRFVPIGIGDYPRTRTDDQPGTGPILAPGHHGRAFRDWASLLRAIAPIENIQLLIVGHEHLDPADRDSVPVPAGVRFLPFVPASEFRLLVEDAPFVVVPLPDRDHSLGQLTVLFCMAMGRAVVATRVMGVEDYVEDGVTGLLTPPGDAEALRAAMASLIRDPERARSMGRAAYRAYRDRFHDARMGADWETMIDELMGTRR